MGFNSYRDLKVWQLSMEMAEQTYHLTIRFPKQETFGLASQIQRAAVSVPSNIAEGHARDSTKEFLHPISIALGSLAELETQLLLSGRLGYVGSDELDSISLLVDQTGRMIRGLQKSLKTRVRES